MGTHSTCGRQKEAVSTPTFLEARSATLNDANRPVVEVTNLTFRYETSSGPELNDISCSFGQGARVLVVGENGAGKSTLLSIVSGKFQVPAHGCFVLDEDLRRGWRRGSDIGSGMWRACFSVNVSFAEVLGDRQLATPRVQELVELFQVDVSWRLNLLSDGQRRRCQLVNLLAEERSLYILDEMSADLDCLAQSCLLTYLAQESRRRGVTVLFASHRSSQRLLREWASHVLVLSRGEVAKCCTVEEVWASATPSSRSLVTADMFTSQQVAEEKIRRVASSMPKVEEDLSLCAFNVSYSYKGMPLALSNISFSLERGTRVLLAGPNGAGKSTLMSILAGGKQASSGSASVTCKTGLHDVADVDHLITHCGDWWGSNRFLRLELRFGDLLGEDLVNSQRCQLLSDILQVDFEWWVNRISDGERRRCHLLQMLATPRSFYIMDEVATDLDQGALEGLMSFLRAETEIRGAAVLYGTHQFDHVQDWATHLLYLSNGQVSWRGAVDQFLAAEDDGDARTLSAAIMRRMQSAPAST